MHRGGREIPSFGTSLIILKELWPCCGLAVKHPRSHEDRYGLSFTRFEKKSYRNVRWDFEAAKTIFNRMTLFPREARKTLRWGLTRLDSGH